MVPVQRSEEVPEGVPVRVEEYLRALVEIQPALKLVMLPREVEAVEAEAPAPVVVPVQVVDIPPLPVHPDLEKASKLVETARQSFAGKRYEKALTVLMQARGLYQNRMAELDSFDRFVDVQTMIAAAFLEGGFNEEGGDAINRLLTIAPGIAPDPQTYGARVVAAVESGRGRIRSGGDITVVADPADAAIYVDGQLIGQGTQTLTDVPRGTHFVRVVGPASFPAARTVNALGGKSSVKIALKSRIPARKAVAAAPKPAPKAATERTLSWYARNGEFQDPGFVAAARNIAQQNMADHVLLSYIARSQNSFQLGLFLFEARTGRVAAVEPAVIDTDLGNLQIALLDLESRLAKTVRAFPEDRVVQSRPAIYALTAPKPLAAPVAVAAPPAPAPAPTPAPAPAPAWSTPAPAAPVALPQRSPVAASGPTGGFDDIPEDFPMEYLEEPSVGTPIHKAWWLWTIVGVAVGAGLGVGLGLGLSGDDGKAGSVTGSANWR
jgi:hypothetical protein